MSDEPPREEDEPTGPQPRIGGEEPTGAHRPFFDSDGEPTRLERPIPPYDPDREPPTSFIMSDPTALGAETSFEQRHPLQEGENSEPKKKRNIAPFVTIALVAILLGLGGGWLLFDEGSDNRPLPPPPTTEAPTTTTTAATTTTAPRTTAPPTTAASTTTSAPATTSTTARPVPSTTTTTATRSSSTVRGPSTSGGPTTSLPGQ